MAIYTANDQINGALRLLGVLAEGEWTSAATSQDALAALNQMIDSWNTERLAVFSTQDQVFNWPPNVLSRTLGPTGDFVGNRPVLLDDSTYFRDPANNISFGIKMINQQQYNDGIKHSKHWESRKKLLEDIGVTFDTNTGSIKKDLSRRRSGSKK